MDEQLERELAEIPADGWVELRAAWRWTCPACRTHAIHYGTRYPPEILLDELRKKYPGLTETQEAQVMERMDQDWAPMVVTCRSCGGRWRTRLPRIITGR